MQRFVWDLHYAPPKGSTRTYPISAIYQDSPSAPMGPSVLPGEYLVKLTVGGRSYTQPLTVRMDPRVKTPPEGLAQQFATAMRCYEGIRQVRETLEQIRKLRARLKELRERRGRGRLAGLIASLDQKAAALEGSSGGGGARGESGRRSAGDAGEVSLTRLNRDLGSLLELVEGADATPTTQAVAASEEVQRALTSLLARWSELRGKEVMALNEQLRRTNWPPLTLEQ